MEGAKSVCNVDSRLSCLSAPRSMLHSRNTCIRDAYLRGEVFFSAPIRKTRLSTSKALLPGKNFLSRGLNDKHGFLSPGSRQYSEEFRHWKQVAFSKDLCMGKKTTLSDVFSPRQRRLLTVRCQAAPRTANLSASQSLTVPLPSHRDKEGRPRSLSEFLNRPVGRESMLKGQACKRKELIDDNTFRCYLRSIEAFKFSVSPVIDVRVISTDDTCTVEMFQCRFIGSEAVERQNDRFSASFRNHINWRENGAPKPQLHNEIRLDLALEVATPPFTLLPLGAIERPGSAFLQTLLDRVAPAFVSSLLADYEAWTKGELDETDVLSGGKSLQPNQEKESEDRTV